MSAQENSVKRGRSPLFAGLVVTTALLLVLTLHWALIRSPEEATMGVVYRIFYFHVPSAYAFYIGATACCVGSVAYLYRPTDWTDALARSGAEAAIVFGIMEIISGALWGAKSWGHYWAWDPRLTTAMLSWLVYIAYVVLRSFSGDGTAERKFAAALGILGAAMLPIIHWSVQKWGGQHPMVVTGSGGGLQHPDMKIAFALGMVAFTLFAITLIWARMRLEIVKSRVARAEEDAIDLGFDERTET